MFSACEHQARPKHGTEQVLSVTTSCSLCSALPPEVGFVQQQPPRCRLPSVPDTDLDPKDAEMLPPVWLRTIGMGTNLWQSTAEPSPLSCLSRAGLNCQPQGTCRCEPRRAPAQELSGICLWSGSSLVPITGLGQQLPAGSSFPVAIPSSAVAVQQPDAPQGHGVCGHPRAWTKHLP